MRVRILTTSLAVIVGCGALGCKSAPKMAWWSSSNDAAKVESTAVAHAAPQLPSEIAKQAEGMNSANPVQISAAPAFVPGSMSSSAAEAAPPSVVASAPVGGYPSTGAKSYVPTTSPTASPAASTTAASSALPYNPNAVPAAKSAPSSQSIAATPAAPGANSAPADRYGNLYSQNSEPVTAPTPTSGGAAPNFSSPANTMATASTDSASSGLGDRYSMSGTPTSAPASVSPPSEPQEVQPASAIASAEPYRPGGTGTYPAIAASNARYEVATRPAAPASSESSVPNAAYPSNGGNQYR